MHDVKYVLCKDHWSQREELKKMINLPFFSFFEVVRRHYYYFFVPKSIYYRPHDHKQFSCSSYFSTDFHYNKNRWRSIYPPRLAIDCWKKLNMNVATALGQQVAEMEKTVGILSLFKHSLLDISKTVFDF